MLINGVEFVERTSENRSPRRRGSGEAVEFTRFLMQYGAVDDTRFYGAATALLGYAVMRSETSTVDGTKVRRWIERSLPHGYPGPPSDDTGSGTTYIWATGIENSSPLSGKNVPGRDDTPTCLGGVEYEVKYKNLSYIVRPDSEVLATDYVESADPTVASVGGGPLAENGGTSAAFPGLPARPDEGDALRRGWLGYSRYVTRTPEDASKVVSLPQGFSFFVTNPAAPADRMPVPTGYPVVDTRTVYRYTWHMVPLEAVPFSAIIAGRGKVNNAVWDGFMNAGTALFDGFNFRVYQCLVSDRWYADLIYKIVHAPRYDANDNVDRGWNSWLRAVGGQARWWPISMTGGDLTPMPAAAADDNRVFRVYDFTKLFRPYQTNL